MTRWLDDDEQAVWRAFIQMNVVVGERLERQMQREAAMPMSYYLVLAMLSEATDRSLRMQQLAQILRSSQSRTSHAIARIEEKGWVRRHRSPEDRRGTLVQLTDAGWQQLLEVAPSHVEAVRESLFDALSPAQVRQLGQICSAVIGRCDEGR